MPITGASVDLTAYAIKRQLNGGGNWEAPLNLTGTLNSGEVFVIVNKDIALTCYDKTKANLSTASSALQFNGNDPVGLFKNGVLIDIIGTLNGGAPDFAKDQTLTRKSNVVSPNSTFNKTVEWDAAANDNCTNLGTHKIDTLSKETFESTAFSISPNPTNGNLNIRFEESDGFYDVALFSLLGQKVFEKINIENSVLSLPNLPSGTYLLRLTKDAKVFTKKLIIN